MPYFAVCDSLSDHPKVLAAGNAAMGVWVRLGSWCQKHLTDGVIPAVVCRSFGRNRDISRLVSVGLLVKVGDAYVMHDYLEHNHSRAEVDRRRSAKRKAGRAGSAKRWASKKDGKTMAGAIAAAIDLPCPSDMHPTQPNPTQPNNPPYATHSGPPKKRRGRRLGDDWVPSAAHELLASELGLDLADQVNRFRDHWLAETGSKATKLDWSRAFNNWLRRAGDFKQPRKRANNSNLAADLFAAADRLERGGQ